MIEQVDLPVPFAHETGAHFALQGALADRVRRATADGDVVVMFGGTVITTEAAGRQDKKMAESRELERQRRPETSRRGSPRGDGACCENLGVAVDRAILFQLATSSRLERLVRSVPGGENAAWRAAARYVAGTTLGVAGRAAAELHKRGIASSLDQFGEQVSDMRTADQAAADYQTMTEELAALPETTWLSVDLSHLGLDVDPQRCTEHLTAIAAALPPKRRIQVGAEDHARADVVLDCVLGAAENGLADRLGATVQANLRRSPADLDRLMRAGIHIRLVKGAFVEPVETAWPYGEATDIAYVRLAHQLTEANVEFALATHDGVLREALLAAFGPRTIEQLLGVRPAVLDDLTARSVPVRVYVPFGESWFRYWMRRLAESRGA